MWHRRRFLKGLVGSTFAVPLVQSLLMGPARAQTRRASRLIIFYFPDGVVGPSQEGQMSQWRATGSEHNFQLGPLMAPLERFRADSVFLNGLSMGGTDSGSHPGGAKKLLTGVDGGNGESVDVYLSRTAGAGAPHRHLYLGAMANVNNASGDKHISYPSPGQSRTPEDDPLRAFERLFGAGAPPVTPPGGGSNPPPTRNLNVSVIDGALAELTAFQSRLGQTEARKLSRHLEALREVENRVKSQVEPEQPSPETPPPADCSQVPRPNTTLGASELYRPARFPEILRLQTDILVQAMACGLSQVGVIQGSHHTSELVMSQFPMTPMFDPGFDMRSHQASHYGARHDPGRREYNAYHQQRVWWVEQFAYLLEQLKARPEGDGTMLDHSVVLLCTEVCDGNTHLHDNMPFVVAGRGGGRINPGRLLQFNYRRHGDLLAALCHALGEPVRGYGQDSGEPLPGLLS